MTETQIRNIIKEESEDANQPIIDQLDKLNKAVIGNGDTKNCLVARMATAETKLWILFGTLIPVTAAIIIELIKKI